MGRKGLGQVGRNTRYDGDIWERLHVLYARRKRLEGWSFNRMVMRLLDESLARYEKEEEAMKGVDDFE